MTNRNVKVAQLGNTLMNNVTVSGARGTNNNVRSQRNKEIENNVLWLHLQYAFIVTTFYYINHTDGHINDLKGNNISCSQDQFYARISV